MLMLSELYNYVFGGRAKISGNQFSENKKKQSEIQQKFKGVYDGKNGEEFRKILRAVHSSDLEIILYGNNTDDLEITENIFPSDKKIKKEFSLLNEKYQYFIDAESKSKAEADFVNYFKACKLNAKILENINNDEASYLQAYKLNVLFGNTRGNNPWTPFENYLKVHNLSKLKNPVGDALTADIPINNTSIDLSVWRAFFQQYGPFAVKIFHNANEIKSELKKDIETFEEVKNTLSSLIYKRANENPELAKLCLRFDLDEHTFDKCLDIKPKKSDNLPDISVDGALVGHSGYHLVKLPINDPHAYVLGHILNCCLYIEGLSEKCVIDGITRENNGFYVLLKDMSGKNNAKPLTDDNKINYKEFEIVGGGYAWLSVLGNLTIDSWDNLRSSDDKVITDILKKLFSPKVTQHDPNIVCVTVGTGLKTPKELKNDKTDFPEKMKEGYQYGESIKQATVFVDSDKQKMIESQLNQLLSRVIDSGLFFVIDEQKLQELILHKSNSLSVDSVKWLEELFLNKNSLDVWTNLIGKNTQNLKLLLDTLNSEGASIYYPLFQLSKNNLLTREHFILILENKDDANDISQSLIQLHNNKLLNKELTETIENNPSYAFKISSAWIALSSANILNQTTLSLIANNAKKADEIANALIKLNEMHLFNSENLDLISKNPREILTVCHVLLTLEGAHILNEGSRQLIAANINYGTSITEALLQLNIKNVPINDHLWMLEKYPEFSLNLSNALISLHQANIPISNNISSKILSEPAKAEEIASDLIKKQNINIITSHKLFARNQKRATCESGIDERLSKTPHK